MNCYPIPTMRITAFVLPLLVVFPPDFQQQFDAEIKQALKIVKQQESQICVAANHYELPSAEVMAMVFPELVRYSYFRDFFETTALEIIYVNLGSREADFSIGQFQMKPSFVEKLEKTVSTYPIAFEKFQFLAEYTETDARDIRKARIQRLKSSYWQIQYAFAFYAVCEACFFDQCFRNQAEKVAFYATAYNLGFDVTVKEIKEWMPVKAFPYGRKYKGGQWAYSELAGNYFQQITEQGSCFVASHSNP